MTDEAHDQEHEHEIVIIKRHGGHEDAHHGGVWKIAFADFMTAMMAFFLVMWLISANDKTKATIAKYFNPVELVDSTPQPRGMNDAKADDPNIDKKSDKTPDAKAKDAKPDATTKESKPDSKAQDGKPSPKADAAPAPIAPPLKDATASTAHDEAELTHDPYAVLAEIANSTHPETPVTTKKPPIEEAQRGVGSQGNKGGDAFRDPFEPPMSGTGDVAPGTGSPRLDPILDNGNPVVAPPKVAGDAAASLKMVMGKVGADKVSAAATPAETTDQPLPPAALRAKIAALVKGPDGAAGAGPRLDVRKTDEGLLISLTDSANFSMFPNASARPVAKMVALVEKIGDLLKSQKGSVVVRGFTDSRPFRSDTYDNWRLSAARAQMAHYMLVQGGLADDRIDRIEGYADRRPKNPKDPLSPDNRRIEILLRDATP